MADHDPRLRPTDRARRELLRSVRLLHRVLDDPALHLLLRDPVHVVVHGPSAGDAHQDAWRRAEDPEGDAEAQAGGCRTGEEREGLQGYRLDVYELRRGRRRERGEAPEARGRSPRRTP